MRKHLLHTLICLLALQQGLLAQAGNSTTPEFGLATPRNMWEIGLHGGYFFVAGDVPQDPGWGTGIHIRKATDYFFSIRMDLFYGELKGSDNNREFTSTMYSSNFLGVFNLNSMRYDKSVRNAHLYGLLGGGVNNFEANYIDGRANGTVPREIAPQGTFGAGIAFRMGKRVNIGLEHQASVLLGGRSDLVDGINTGGGTKSVFRDVLNYSRLGININIGNSTKYSEPLYWISPLDMVLKDLNDIKSKQDMALADSDTDGVIDAIDMEPNTPPDVPVDTKGRTLDSDKDGVPDYKDIEPYNPPRAGEIVDTDGVIVNPMDKVEGVSEERVKELIDIALQENKLTESASSVAEWFLPMIHFPVSDYAIRYSDYGTLSGIAQMLKNNSQLKLVVVGFTDQTGDEGRNKNLSYDRALSVIEHLVNNHGIGRGRLILQFRGQEDALVPSASNYMNRRVEFRVAKPDDNEMDPPEGYFSRKKDGY